MKPSIKKGIIITSVCAFTLVGIKFWLNRYIGDLLIYPTLIMSI